MEDRVMDFERSLLELIDFAQVVRSCNGLLLESLPVFEQTWQRASIIDEWFRMGWRFAGRRRNAQVSEVLTWHYQAVGGRPGG